MMVPGIGYGCVGREGLLQISATNLLDGAVVESTAL